MGTPSANLPLGIEERTGWVVTTATLDRENQPKFQLTVVASDSGEPPRSATASLAIVVQDVNDNDPVFESKVFYIWIIENYLKKTRSIYILFLRPMKLLYLKMLILELL